MDKIAQWLKAYIDAHPFDSGDSDCEVYCVLADSHFPRKEQSDLCTTWEFLLECIVKD